VKLLEASGRIGGRVKDDFSLGPCVGLGAMFITGVNNNPLTLLASQLGLGLHYTNEDRCELINEEGWRPDSSTDKRVETHFNKALDKLAEWRNNFTQQDVALGGELPGAWVWSDILWFVHHKYYNILVCEKILRYMRHRDGLYYPSFCTTPHCLTTQDCLELLLPC